MSHFALLVRVPAETKEADLERRVAEMMVPYKEYGAGDSDSPETRKYLEFIDDEAEHQKDYDTKSATFVACHQKDGHRDNFRLVLPCDEGIRVPGTIGTGSDTHKAPDVSWEVTIPFKLLYPTFDKYMSEWCGSSKRDPEKGRYGHWKNPNDKYDYFRIGGRYRGKLMVHSGAGFLTEPSWEWTSHPREDSPMPNGPLVADFCRLAALDWPRIDSETAKRADEFWQEWQDEMDGKDFPMFEGPRDSALALGLLECKSASELDGTEWKKRAWSRQPDRFDVYKPATREWLAERQDYFLPIRPWAVLDSHGWRERGEMGWFAMSNETEDSVLAFVKAFRPWAKGGDQNDWVVMLDCHI